MNATLRSRPVRLLAMALAALVVIEATLVPHAAPKFPWHHLPGYATILGAGGALLLIWVATALGRAFLRRPERGND